MCCETMVRATTSSEVPHKDLLSKLLKEPAFSDITLEGIDGMTVAANRYILASKSKVLQELLLSSGTAKAHFQIHFSSSILEAVVEYVYTDTAQILDVSGMKGDCAPDEMFQVTTIFALTRAAHYFDLPGLHTKMQQSIQDILQSLPSLTLIVLEAANDFPHPQILERCMANIRLNVQEIRNPDAVAFLSPKVLREILQYENHTMSPFQLFEMLRMWEEAEVNGIRRSTASELTKYIRLDLIDALQLSDSVASSGLVTREQFLKAFQTQDLASSSNREPIQKVVSLSPIQKCVSLSKYHWKDTASDVVRGEVGVDSWQTKLLEYPHITSGLHQWTIQIEEMSDKIGLGVGKRTHNSNSIGPHGWQYYSDGVAIPDNEEDFFPTFSAGSKVTLTLNLLDSHSGGRLSVCVDGGAVFTVFSGLQLDWIHHTPLGFIPTASFQSTGCVRLLEIKELDEEETVMEGSSCGSFF